MSAHVGSHEETVAALRQRVAALEAANEDLLAFAYSVSHELSAPVRPIDSLRRIVPEDIGEVPLSQADRLLRVQDATQRLRLFIDDLLRLSRVTRCELRHETVDLSAAAASTIAELRKLEPWRNVAVSIQPGVVAEGDARLLGVVVQILLANAWKYTALRECGHIAFGVRDEDGNRIYFVRDNGSGFDAASASEPFAIFRLPAAESGAFAGTGISLATVKRIVERHGGRVWADSAVNRGATLRFTVGPSSSSAASCEGES
jgi:light-regulated signal transduction histidine kinase (bacteriophytochrome)